MVRFKHYHCARVYGIQYWFDHLLDALPEHAHDDSTAHNIVCLQGTVHLIFANGEVQRITAGDICDFDWSRRHRIVATGPAVILNLFLNGMPEGYDRLPAEELAGMIGNPP